MKRTLFCTIIAGGLALASACANASAGKSPEQAADNGELALPTIPDNLTDPQARADYLVVRFWNALDFSDATSGCRDTAFMEQNFANFASVMPHASSDSVRSRAIGNLLSAASASDATLDLTAWVAETYLNSTDSPVYSESLYILFLKQLAVSPKIDEAMRERYAAQLADMEKNRPGDIATDFTYKTVAGKSSSLHKLAAQHDSTLVVIYDPDCLDCHKLIDSLSVDDGLRSAVRSGSMAVMALYPYDDTDLWRATASELPDWWIIASNPNLDADGTYYIPRTPRTFLLSRDARIVSLEE
jgi:hypothetical protein